MSAQTMITVRLDLSYFKGRQVGRHVRPSCARLLQQVDSSQNGYERFAQYSDMSFA